jgi:hypothetical protein
MKKARKLHYRVKSWVIFNKGQFTHICQFNVSYGQDSVSGIVRQTARAASQLFQTQLLCPLIAHNMQ